MPRNSPAATETPVPELTTGSAFALYLYRRWWFIAAQAAAAVVALVVVLGLTSHTTYDYTAHFVLHPDASSNLGDVANAASVLRQDDPLVQTVLKVIPNNEIRRRCRRGRRNRPVELLGVGKREPGQQLLRRNRARPRRGRDRGRSARASRRSCPVTSTPDTAGSRSTSSAATPRRTHPSLPAPASSCSCSCSAPRWRPASSSRCSVSRTCGCWPLAPRREPRSRQCRPSRSRNRSAHGFRSRPSPRPLPRSRRSRNEPGSRKVANGAAPADAPPVVEATTEAKPKSKRTRAVKSDPQDEASSVSALERPSWWPERVRELEALEPDAQPTSDDRRSAAGR